MAARIVAVADVYDALASRRVYKEPYPHEDCIGMISGKAGTHFDPDIIEVWLTIENKFRDIARRFSGTRATQGSYDSSASSTVDIMGAIVQGGDPSGPTIESPLEKVIP